MKIEWLYQEFRSVQQKVEFVLPVYLVLSEMHELAGFQDAEVQTGRAIISCRKPS